MKFMAVVIILTSITSFADIHQIKCSGSVNAADFGTMTGQLNVLIKKNSDENWDLNNFPAGKNKSSDPDMVILDNYSLLGCRRGAMANYNARTRTLQFKYKYDSGFLGGGCQKTGSTFLNCTEE